LQYTFVSHCKGVDPPPPSTNGPSVWHQLTVITTIVITVMTPAVTTESAEPKEKTDPSLF